MQGFGSFINQVISVNRTIFSLLLIILLNACGGGGSISRDQSNTPDDPDTTFQFSIALSIAERDTGNDSNELNAETPLTITARVSDQDGAAIEDQLVTFTFNTEELATFDPASGTALTDAQGIATIDLLAGSTEGGGLVTARLETGETDTIGFNSAGDASLGTKSVEMSILSKITAEPSNSLSANNPLTVNALVTDSDGAPVVDELITFSFTRDDLAFFTPPTGTALTDSTGTASIELIVGESAGAAKVLATTATGETGEIGFNSAGGGTNVAEQPATLDFFTSALQIASSGSDEVELIALVKNAQNILMQDIDVSFSSDSGELQITQGTTAADGTARALLTSRNNPENRTITVMAETGSLSRQLEIQVTGTEVKINAPGSVTLNDNAPITIVIADSDGVGIPNQQVALTSEVGNEIDNPTPVTDETGQVTVLYTATQAGSDTFTAEALNASATQNISVQEDEFTFTERPSEDIPLRTDSNFTVTWLKNNEPFVGGNIVFNSTRGTTSIDSGVTDENGQVSFSVTSTSAGDAIIGARGTDNDGGIVNARAEVEFVATSVSSIIVSANPNSIGPDGQKSTITAVLRDEVGNLVKGIPVDFNVNGIGGGSLFPELSTTDSNGLASTVYTSDSVTTEDAISITANAEGISSSTNLTVADRALFISLGTGNQIESTPDAASYLKRFSVFVTDANSNPVSNVALTVSGTPVKHTELLDPNAVEGDPNFQTKRPAFYKGYWEAFPSLDAFEFWIAVQTIGCPNEDIDDDGILDIEDKNGNSVLDPGEDLDGDGMLDLSEDVNGDGNLTPGNIVAIDGNIVTDQNGQATIELRYPKTFAAWVTIQITVSTPVAGSENRVSQLYTLGASGADLAVETSPPNSNPFGDGRNFVQDPDDDTQLIDDGTARVCTNRE
ncbi:MAG: Ig-like domain-containing protein [Aestuariibacter sp.]